MVVCLGYGVFNLAQCGGVLVASAKNESEHQSEMGVGRMPVPVYQQK